MALSLASAIRTRSPHLPSPSLARTAHPQIGRHRRVLSGGPSAVRGGLPPPGPSAEDPPVPPDQRSRTAQRCSG
eukprot:15479022-Alexandrium_andersonii.AAC.1